MMKNTKRNTDQVAAPFNLSRRRATTGSGVERRTRTETDERNARKTQDCNIKREKSIKEEVRGENCLQKQRCEVETTQS